MSLLLVFVSHLLAQANLESPQYGQFIISNIPSGTYDIEKEKMVYWELDFVLYIKRAEIDIPTQTLSLVTLDRSYEVIQIIFRESMEPFYVYKLKTLLTQNNGYAFSAHFKFVNLLNFNPLSIVTVPDDKVLLRLKLNEEFKPLEFYLCEKPEAQCL